MGKVVEKKKKKKGRPSLLDLQKRTLKQQQEEQQQQNQQKQNQIRNFSNSKTSTLHSSHNYKSATPTPLRRSTRRNPTPSSPETQSHHSEHDDDDAALKLNVKKRREKKLKLVLKLPSSQKSDLDSASLNSNGSDSNAEEEATVSYNKKRKINVIADGSGSGVSDKAEKSVSGTNPTKNVQDSGPSTPLPDKKLLLFILERLQKKDTYGVFSEPVDPNELPDYHEVIEHPMDFLTVRKNLSSGVYASLEQFEKDIFSICSNAMQYNAPDTIYFRQARSIQELAKKNFENLRQDSDDNEPEPKIVRRGRPPTKNIKKPPGRPSVEHAGSEFPLDATLAAGGENTIWSNNDLRKGPHISEKSIVPDSSGRSHGSRNDAYWLADNKFERNEELSGSIFKGNSMKYGKKQFALDENRRNTYKQLSAGGQEPSVLTTFDSERKQLMAVALLTEHGYARSLARFAANIGIVAWKIASRKIERSLPPGVKFGPGWVGENGIPPQREWLVSSPPQGLPSSSQPLTLPADCVAATSGIDSKEKLSEKPENNVTDSQVFTIQSASGGQLSNAGSPSTTLSASLGAASKSETAAIKSETCMERAEVVEGLNSHGGFNMSNNKASMIRPMPPFQIYQNRVVHPGINGFNGTYGFNLATQMGKLVGAARPAGTNFHSSQMIDRVSMINTNFNQPARENSLNSENPRFSENSDAIDSSWPPPKSGNEVPEAQISGLESQPSWQELPQQPKPDPRLSPQQISDSVPPDLNVRFQSPGSPSSSRVDSAQPDLALQL